MAKKGQKRFLNLLLILSLFLLAACSTQPQKSATTQGSGASPGVYHQERAFSTRLLGFFAEPLNNNQSKTEASNVLDAVEALAETDVAPSPSDAHDDSELSMGLVFHPSQEEIYGGEHLDEQQQAKNISGSEKTARANIPNSDTLPQDPIVPASPTDVLERLRTHFALPDGDHNLVAAHTKWYAKHKNYLKRTFERATPFLFYIAEEIEKRGIPGEIALLPVVESAFQPFAYSHGRAAGIWQFIPATGKHFGLKITWWYDGRRDVLASTHAALDYLQALHKRFNGDWLLALAAYNSGEGTVARAIKRNRRANKPTDFWSLKLPRETRGYVPRLLGISAVIADPQKYQVNLKPIPNQPYLDTVDPGSQIDIALAAELADMTMEEMYLLNAGINRWATDPNGPHRLVVPLDKAQQLKDKLAKIPAKKRVQWQRHQVKKGDSLIKIAHKYNTTPTVIRQVNNLHSHLIRVKQHLIIPVAQRSLNNYVLSADQRLQKTQNKRRNKNKRIHTVKRGDTLWDIARKHKVSVTKLASWNGMATRDTLKINQKLVVWTKNGRTTYQQPQHKPQRIRYTVRKGDSLARIAQRFNVSVKNLQRWNSKSLAKKKYLQPGQKLTLYVDVTRTTENS